MNPVSTGSRVEERADQGKESTVSKLIPKSKSLSPRPSSSSESKKAVVNSKQISTTPQLSQNKKAPNTGSIKSSKSATLAEGKSSTPRITTVPEKAIDCLTSRSSTSSRPLSSRSSRPITTQSIPTKAGDKTSNSNSNFQVKTIVAFGTTISKNPSRPNSAPSTSKPLSTSSTILSNAKQPISNKSNIKPNSVSKPTSTAAKKPPSTEAKLSTMASKSNDKTKINQTTETAAKATPQEPLSLSASVPEPEPEIECTFKVTYTDKWHPQSGIHDVTGLPNKLKQKLNQWNDENVPSSYDLSEVACDVLTLLYDRDFSGSGKHWSYDGVRASAEPSDNDDIHKFECEISHTWDWKDIYSVASGKATIFINVKARTIFVDKYYFYCAG